MTNTNGSSSDHVQRERELQTKQRLLEYAVSRAVFCPYTGRTLDKQRTVLVNINDGEQALIMDCEAFDGGAVKGAIGFARGHNKKVEVLDGRALFA